MATKVATRKQTTPVKPNVRARRTVIEDKAIDTLITKKTFLLWCPMPTIDSGLAETIHALYFLPQNFILMLPHIAAKDEEISMIISQSPLAGRVQFYDKEGSLRDEPSLLADAVICGKTYAAKTDTPVIVVSTDYEGLTASEHGYMVTRSPEAIASALLKIARDS